MFPHGNLWLDALGLTDDPDQAKKTRRRLWLLSVPTALAWAVAGWSGSLGILDQFRVMSLNPTSTWDTPAGSTASLTMIFAVAVTAASSLGFAMSWTGFGSSLRAGAFATSAGLTVGTTLAISSWTAPAAVGSRAPDDPWTDADWVVYYEPYLVPAVFAVAAAITGALTLRAAWATASKEDTEGAIRRLGRRVPGTLDHVEFTHVWLHGNPRFRVQVTYPGTTGLRTVVTTMTTSPFTAPLPGSTVDVLYHPADDENIIVEPRGTR